MKIVIIDGQGGRMGGLLAEKIKKAAILGAEIYALGTNSAATTAMLKAGADYGATGENPVLVNCRDADYIIGPLGIMAADALLGEEMCIRDSHYFNHKKSNHSFGGYFLYYSAIFAVNSSPNFIRK